MHRCLKVLMLSFVFSFFHYFLFFSPKKIRQKLKSKQEAMEKSEKAKQLRAMRKYGKKVRRSYKRDLSVTRI